MPQANQTTLGLDDKSPIELEQMRAQIIARAAGDHRNMSIEDLQLLAAIFGVLRRRTAGPVKSLSKPKASKAKANVADILSSL